MSGTKPHTVLVVDDDPTMRSLLSRAIRQMRMEIVLAGSLAETREHLEAGLRPDLIVTDYILGDGVGSEVVALARRLGLPAPTILITATPDALHGSEVLFVDVLHKPFRLSVLYDALEVARQQVRPRLQSGTSHRADTAGSPNAGSPSAGLPNTAEASIELPLAAGDDD